MVGEIRRETGVQSTVETATVSERIVRTVADRTGSDPVDLPPLFEVVDAAVLDSLFARPDASGLATFDYYGFEVTVHSDGRVEVAESTE